MYVCVRDVMDFFVFCLYCETWSCSYLWMGNVTVLSCRYCVFVHYGHLVAVLNAAFYTTCH